MDVASSPMKLGAKHMDKGILIETDPLFLPEYSNPKESNYYFTYKIRITNHSDKTVKLIFRHWVIINGEGDKEEVKGSGVVGKHPILGKNQSFAYSSYCAMDTDWGTMEGAYTFEDQKGTRFDVPIPRFYLTTARKGNVPDLSETAF